MGLISKVAAIDKKFSWSFFGFVLAAMFGGVAIYTEFIRDLKPVVKFEILSNTSILDVKEDVSGLSIIYNTEDIRKSNKKLSVLILRIGNEGRSPILKTYYDNVSPLGLRINSGEIIKAEVITATTDYLKQSAGIHITDSSNAEFSQIIIEPNESFTAKFLVLNPAQSTLTVFPKGKIAGVKKLLLSDITSDQTKETFLMKVISGSIWVQMSRIPIYVIIFIALLIIIIAPSIYISTKKDQMKRNKVIKQFKSISDSNGNELNAEIYATYKQSGLQPLQSIKKYLTSNKEFDSLVTNVKALETEDNGKVEPDRHADVEMMDILLDRRNAPIRLMETMLRLGLVSKVGESYTKNEERIKLMNEFIQFAKRISRANK